MTIYSANHQPMALATGSPSIPIQIAKWNSDRSAAPEAIAHSWPDQTALRRAAEWFVPGGRGSCRSKAKLGSSLSLPYVPRAGRFQSAARLRSQNFMVTRQVNSGPIVPRYSEGEGSQINARYSAVMNRNILSRLTFAAYPFRHRFVWPAHGSRNRPNGFTLIEAMIAITMTLIIMLALAQGFKRLSDDISQGRARLALSDQLRSVSEVLRNDLANLTVDPDPTNSNNKLGYFLYYDGPVTDYTAATLPINTDSSQGATTERLLSASKYGDFDDILMFTAKANGDFFKGRVPLAVVLGAAAAQAVPPSAYTPSQADWANSVVMASEFAEIAYFMMPMNVGLNAAGETELMEPSIDGAGSLLFEDREVPVNPGATFIVPSGRPLLPIAGVGNGVPDRMILCRRVMLIIPSLNISAAGLQQLTNTDSSPNTSPSLRLQSGLSGAFAMSSAYQGCDLSVRRTHTTGTVIPVAANSLEDLANPANRFAHTMLTFAANPSTTTTMPILALTSPIPIQEYALSKGAQIFGAATTGVALTARPNTTFLDYGNPSFSESGFISPSFLRHKRGLVDHDNNTITPPIVRDLGIELSESLAMNCVSFDLKGFDPSARLLFNAGPDGDVGTASNRTFGVAGTDDLVLSPNDPGYDQSLRYLYALPSFTAAPPTTWPTADQTLPNLTASIGCFVDVGWGMKSIFATATTAGILSTPLSGRDSSGNASNAMKQSGRVLFLGVVSGVRSYTMYQPCFDSFTDTFENDGFNQFNDSDGISFVGGRDYLNGTAAPATLPNGADLALNGLDDFLTDTSLAANGIVDDLDERDTSPPINFAMPAIQATIRLEDKQAGVIQQIAVTQSLVNP